MKRDPISPEEFDRIEQGLDKIARTINLAHRELLGDEPMGFEHEFLEAWRNRDARFFQAIASLCEIRTKLWLDRNSDTAIVTLLARQTKSQLIADGKPVDRPTIRRLVELEWAALRTDWDPKQSEWGEVLDSRSYYAWILSQELKEGKNREWLRKMLNERIAKFPESIWKDVWKDPFLADVKLGKPGRHRR